MESIVNKPPSSISRNLHPVWYRHFGIQAVEPTRPERKPRNAGEALIQAVQKLAAAHHKTR